MKVERTVLLAAIALLRAGSAEVVLAGWECFENSSSQATTVNDANTSARIILSTFDNNDIQVKESSCDDGTFGTVSGARSISANDNAIEIAGTSGGLTLTINITNNNTYDMLLEGLHFDTWAEFLKSARRITIQTGGSVSTYDSGAIYHEAKGSMIVAGAVNDFDDFDFDLSTLLGDHTLAPGESAILSISLNNGKREAAKNFIDNIAITGSYVGAPAPKQKTLGFITS